MSSGLPAALDEWVEQLSRPTPMAFAEADESRGYGVFDSFVLDQTRWTQRDLEHLQPGVFRDAVLPVGVQGVQGAIRGDRGGLLRPDKSFRRGGVRINEEWDWNDARGRASSRAHETAHLQAMQDLYRHLSRPEVQGGAELARRLIEETRSRFQLRDRRGGIASQHDVGYRVVNGRVEAVAQADLPATRRVRPVQPADIAHVRRQLGRERRQSRTRPRTRRIA